MKTTRNKRLHTSIVLDQMTELVSVRYNAKSGSPSNNSKTRPQAVGFLMVEARGVWTCSIKLAAEANSTMTTIAVHVHAVLAPLALPCARSEPFGFSSQHTSCTKKEGPPPFGGDPSFFVWRRGESNPCPKITPHKLLRV